MAHQEDLVFLFIILLFIFFFLIMSKFETIAIQGFLDPKNQQHTLSTPIYASTAFAFDSIKHAADLFDLKVAGNIYSRLTNPTNEILENRLASLEGGVGALVVASGQSATLISILNITHSGDEIIASNRIYGGTSNLFDKTLRELGINTKFVDLDNKEQFESAFTDKTRCVFVESLGNPSIRVADIEYLAKISHKNGVPLIVDNTVPSSYLCQPIKWGADIVVHSTTKYLSGSGNAMGGVIVDSGNFDWNSSDKFKGLTTPDESYHGITYTKDFGKAGYIAKARAHLIRDLGCCQSPFNSYLTLVGLETLAVRMDRHCENTKAVVKYLSENSHINFVNYPDLQSSQDYALAKKYLPKGCSSLISFGVNGDCVKFIEALKVFRHATNLGTTLSIITYPYATTHAQLTEEQKKEVGITKDYLRASIGIENIDDIIEDLNNAIKISTR